MEQIILKHLDGSTLNLQSRGDYRKISKATQSVDMLAKDVVDVSVESSTKLTFQIGDKITIIGRDYTLNQPARESKDAEDKFIYDLQFEGVQYDLLRAEYNVNVDTTSGKVQDINGDSLTGDIKIFLDVMMANILRVFPGKWTLGTYPAGTDTKTLTFSEGDNCLSVLQNICREDNYNTEFEILIDQNGNRTINIGSVGKVFAQTFKYGRGKGLYKLTREKQSSSNIVTRLNVFGGSKNINTSKYRASKLCLPGRTKSQSYLEDAAAIGKYGIWESTKTFEEVFPKIPGKPYGPGFITGLGSTVLEFVDSHIDFDINAKDENGNTLYMLAGTSPKVHFNTGNLAGYEFEMSAYDHATKKFTLVEQTDENGYKFPSATSAAFQFAANDDYVLLDIKLPDTYETAAETLLQTKGTDYLNRYKQPQVQYGLTVDKFYLRYMIGTEVESNIIWVGDYIPVKDTDLNIDKSLRVKGFTRDLMDEYPAYTSITISDLPVTVSTQTRVITELKIIDSIIRINDLKDPARARRNWKVTSELVTMVETMQAEAALIGNDPAAQYTLSEAMFSANYQGNANSIYASDCVIAHSVYPVGNPGTWNVTEGIFTSLTPAVPYYLYIKANKSDNSALFFLSSVNIAAEAVAGYYHFPVGLLSSVIDGRRVFQTAKGYTLITGDDVKTGRVSSHDGSTYFDLDGDAIQMGEKLKYNVNGDGLLEIDGSIMQHTSVKDDGGNISEITLDRGPFTLSMNPFFPGNITTFEGAAYLCHTLTVPGVVPTNTNYFRPYSEKGAGGKSPVYGYLTNEHNQLSASNAGVVADYSKACGQFKMYRGEEDVTPYSTFKAVSKDCEGTIKESQQLIHDWTDGVVQGHLDTSANWQELSGLTAAYKAGNEKYLWVLSDSPANMIAAIKKSDASNQGVWLLAGNPSKVDWEDIESSVVSGVPYLYVFDYGNNPNNTNSRGAGIDMVIHRILEPTITGSNGNTAEYISIPCVFPAANMPTLRDCEAAIIDPVTGDIYIITKREAVPGVYKLSHQDNYVGIQTLTYMGKMWDVPDATTQALGATACNVVDATINKAGTEIIVKNYNDMYLFLRNPATQSIFQALQGIPTVVAGYVGGGSATPAKSHPSAEPQGEGICFDEMGLHLYSHSEYATGSAAGRFPLFKYSRINAASTTFSMQEGVIVASAIYAGTRDTYIWDTNPDTAYGAATTFVIDNANATDVDRRKGLLRFELGGGVGIPANAIVVGARLDLNIAVEGQGYIMYKMLVPWTEESTFNTLGGITPDGIKASSTPDCINAINLDGYIGQVRNNVPISTIQEWISNPDKNFGWMFDAADAATGDGVQVSSREDAVIANRPKLTIRYILASDIAGSYKITSIPTSVDNGELRLTGTYDGISIEKVFSVSKSKLASTSFKSIVFIRADNLPATPTDGSYSDPVPTGWSDGVSTGTAKLWMSTRIFSSNGQYPQQSVWTTPTLATSTTGIEIMYSESAIPETPSTSQNWSTNPTIASIWMAIRITKDGIAGVWSVTKIKGETGATGAASPLMPNRMNWVPGGTYEGSATRQDLARNPGDGIWYRANPNAGIFTDAVWTPAHWVSFGYSGDSVATILLLAELANIANFIFRDGIMISQAGTVNGVASTDYANVLFVPYLSLDGTTGEITASNMTALGKFRTAVSGARVEIDNKNNAITIFDSNDKSQVVMHPSAVRSVSDLIGGATTSVTYAAHSVNVNQGSAQWEQELGVTENIILGAGKVYEITTPAISYNASVTPASNAARAEITISLINVTKGLVVSEIAYNSCSSSQPGVNAAMSATVPATTIKGINVGSTVETFKMRVKVIISGDGELAIHAEVSANEVLSGTVVLNYSEIGIDGYNFMTDADNFDHFGTDGKRTRGPYDVPAGLGGCFVPSTGGVNSGWGKYAPISAPKAGSTVTITHNIGDTNYMINVSPKDSASTWYWTNKTANTIQVVITGAFDFSLSRTI